jgi:N12 class adenine-specific DNA methylase
MANTIAYQQPFSERAATIREMRRKRLVDNWKRRKEQRSLSRDDLKTSAHDLETRFQKFEDQVQRRVEALKADRDLWSEIVKEMLDDPMVEERNAYWELARHESPGKVELERKPTSQQASEL